MTPAQAHPWSDLTQDQPLVRILPDTLGEQRASLKLFRARSRDLRNVRRRKVTLATYPTTPFLDIDASLEGYNPETKQWR